MSKSIIKRSIELFGDSATENDIKKSELVQKKKLRKLEDKTCSSFTKGLSLEKRGGVKNIDQIRKQYSKQRDHTEDNLRKLMALSKTKINKEKTTSIFKRGSRCREEPKIVEKVESTVFTEEDFAMFEREYVVD